MRPDRCLEGIEVMVCVSEGMCVWVCFDGCMPLSSYSMAVGTSVLHGITDSPPGKRKGQHFHLCACAIKVYIETYNLIHCYGLILWALFTWK